MGASNAKPPSPEDAAAECLLTLAAASASEDLGSSLSSARRSRALAGASILVTMAKNLARVRALLDAALKAK